MKSHFSSGERVDEWEALVGKAILRFGEIELISMKCLAFLQIAKISDKIARINFSSRAASIIKLLEARKERDNHLNALLEGFKRAKELAKTRNLIAHNPVILDWYVSEDETESSAEHLITTARSGNKPLDLEGLKEFAGEVDDLAANLWMHFTNAAGTSDHLWRAGTSAPRNSRK
jgi:hypothetical protein